MQIICVGRNYVEHAKELANPVPASPVIFLKSESSLCAAKGIVPFPKITHDLHFECELVFRMGKGGFDVSEAEAPGLVDGIGLGIDLTARDLQSELKAKSLPWTLAKAFAHGAPTSDFLPIADFPDWADLNFTCEINGQTRQNGHSADMIFSVPYLISFISRYMRWQPGDLLYTGTPAGVGQLQPGDHVTAALAGHALIDFHVE